MPHEEVLQESRRASPAPMLLNAERLKAVMKAEGIDAVVATSAENVTYTSGYWALSQWIRRGPQIYVLLPAADLAASEIIASTTLLDQIADQQDVWVQNVRRYGYFQVDRSNAPLDDLDSRQAELYALPDNGDAIRALVAAIQSAGLSRSRIAIDEMGLLPGHWEKLCGELPDARLVPGFQLLRRVRAVKTAEEIARLRRVAWITEASIDAALAVAREGATEGEMARAFHGCTVSHDAFPVIGCIGFGTRAAMPNVQPSATRLKSGEVIRLDVGGRYKHYRADIARMAVLGEADDKTATYVRALHVGVLKALEMIRPGVKASALFETAVEAVRREGIPHYNRSHVGHGIGVDGYDLPDLTPASKDVIEEGMVMCVETPYYELGWAGLQVEDMIVVRSDGIESLMTSDGGLRVMR
jgi:Xaa-Pro dipeptidase